MRITLVEALRALYTCEINCRIESFWDGGWCAKIGDDVNGFKAEMFFDDPNDAGKWFVDKSRELYTGFKK